MAIQPGAHLGPYEILSAIGAGRARARTLRRCAIALLTTVSLNSNEIDVKYATLNSSGRSERADGFTPV